MVDLQPLSPCLRLRHISYFCFFHASLIKNISGSSSTNGQNQNELDFLTGDTIGRKNALIFSWQQIVLCPPAKIGNVHWRGHVSRLKTAGLYVCSWAIIIQMTNQLLRWNGRSLCALVVDIDLNGIREDESLSILEKDAWVIQHEIMDLTYLNDKRWHWFKLLNLNLNLKFETRI